MKSTIKSNENNRVVIEFKGGFEELEPHIEDAYKKNKGRFNVPGFRRGRVPRKMIELHYGEGVFYDDALNALISDSYTKALDEHDLYPVAQPDVELEQLEKGKEIGYSMTVVVKPVPVLGEYKNLDVKKEEAVVSEEEVDELVKIELEKNARLVPVEREAKMGDVLITTNHITDDHTDHEVVSSDDNEQEITLEEGRAPKVILDALVGMKVDEEKEVEEEHTHGDHTHKLVHHLKVLEVKEKQLPEMDDEFVMDISDFTTVSDYREDLKEQLLEQKKEEVEHKYENDRIQAAINNMQVDVPEEMITDTQERMFQNYAQQIAQQGLSIDQYLQFVGQTKEDILEQMKDQAKQRVLQELLFEAIVKDENIEVSDEEIETKLEEIAKMMEKEVDEIRDIYGFDNYAYLRDDLKYQKAVDLVLGKGE